MPDDRNRNKDAAATAFRVNETSMAPGLKMRDRFCKRVPTLNGVDVMTMR